AQAAGAPAGRAVRDAGRAEGPGTGPRSSYRGIATAAAAGSLEEGDPQEPGRPLPEVGRTAARRVGGFSHFSLFAGEQNVRSEKRGIEQGSLIGRSVTAVSPLPPRCRQRNMAEEPLRSTAMKQVHPHALWLGHAGDGTDYRAILDAGIRAVVQVAAERPPLQPPRDLVYCRSPLVDGPGNDTKLLLLAVTTVANLLDRRFPPLVCCGGGLSRSPAVAAAALAMVFQETPEDSLRQVA